MGEMIALKTLRGRYAYARYALEWLYVGLVKDLNRDNDAHHVFSDAYKRQSQHDGRPNQTPEYSSS